jgi:C4-dicarboxylate transporter
LTPRLEVNIILILPDITAGVGRGDAFSILTGRACYRTSPTSSNAVAARM